MRTSAIYIDDTLVDIGRDEIMRLSLNYSIADIREVDTRSADFSHTTGLHIPVDAGVAAAFLR